MTQRRNKAILPELVPPKGFAIVHDCVGGHDVLVLRRNYQHAPPAGLPNVVSADTAGLCKLEVGWHALQLGILSDLPPSLQVLPPLGDGLCALPKPLHRPTPQARLLRDTVLLALRVSTSMDWADSVFPTQTHAGLLGLHGLHGLLGLLRLLALLGRHNALAKF